ncbi:MAG: hypothetical protein ACRDZY_20190, partial [Acidimicrobiales bacterium]
MPGPTNPGPATPGPANPAPAPAPFDTAGIETGPDGIRRYTGLPTNLVRLLRQSVDAAGNQEAVVELGGVRLT